MLDKFSLGNDRLNSRTLVKLSQKPSPPVEAIEERWAHVQQQRELLDHAIAESRTIYGVNTGFGFLSQVRIPKEQVLNLQVYLIRSHACAVGEYLSKESVRGLLLLKAHNFLQGYSGVSAECIRSILQFIKHDILPAVPSKGSVGASGDLAPLAHLALGLIGEGKVCYDGSYIPASEAYKAIGAKPLIPRMKEGLALINGTHFMSVEGSFAIEEARNLIAVADIALALSLNGIKGTSVAFDPRIHNLRPHQGQKEAASNIYSLLGANSETAYSKVQDPYSFRCAAQVHGMARTTWDFVNAIVETELNSITDNPLVFDNGDVLSGGNFHGAPLANSFDYLSIALSGIGNISERRTEKLTNPSMSGLPAFLTKEGGVNSGFMIPHVVSAALASENKTLAHPASVDTIPTSADKEDHVSMGAFAARKLRLITKNISWILAIELLSACQAIDLADSVKLNSKLQKFYDKIRSVSSRMDSDRSLHEDIETLASSLLNGEFLGTGLSMEE